MATTFAAYNTIGNELEDLVDAILKRHGKPYKRNAVGADGDLTAQHMGDFQIGRNLFLECKNDQLFSKTGNLYLEIGEIRDKNAPKDARTIQPIGVLKHASKAPTIIIHQVGEDRFFVYSVRQALAAIADRRDGLRWNERPDYRADREDKTNIGILVSSSKLSSDGKLRAIFRETDAADLLRTVQAAVAMEKLYEEDQPESIVDLARIWDRVAAWKAEGWHRFAIVSH